MASDRYKSIFRNRKIAVRDRRHIITKHNIVISEKLQNVLHNYSLNIAIAARSAALWKKNSRNRPRSRISRGGKGFSRQSHTRSELGARNNRQRRAMLVPTALPGFTISFFLFDECGDSGMTTRLCRLEGRSE